MINRSFLETDDVCSLAKYLLGKVLCSNIDGIITKGRIVETEAYSGTNDKACHAYLGRNTNRTKVMFGKAGLAYIYLCYGIHHLLNVVTNQEGKADAILIRALEPLQGLQTMKQRTKFNGADYKLCAGPGKLTKALGITKKLNETDLLNSNSIWLELNDYNYIDDKQIVESTRIGIDYAEEDKYLPWRYYLKNNNAVSKY